MEVADETGPIEGEEDAQDYYPTWRSEAIATLEELSAGGEHPLDAPNCPLGKDLWFSPDARAVSNVRADLAHGYARLKAASKRKRVVDSTMRAAALADPIYGKLNRFLFEEVYYPHARIEETRVLSPEYKKQYNGLMIKPVWSRTGLLQEDW